MTQTELVAEINKLPLADWEAIKEKSTGFAGMMLFSWPRVWQFQKTVVFSVFHN